METIDQVKHLMEPLVERNKYYIVGLTYKREGGKPVLRIILDKEGGITMEECANFNNELGELLDKDDIMAEPYLLEVSSPGLDRRLTGDNDYRWAMGKKIKVSTYAPFNERKVFIGTLIGMREDVIVIEENGISIEIPKDKIANAKLNPDINWGK